MTTWLMPAEFVKKVELLEAASLSVTSQIAQTPEVASTPVTVKRGGVAEISIKGTLVKERSQMLDFFGIPQTSYVEIADQTKAAVSKGAKKIVYRIDSPGGDANGILLGMDAIKNSGVPTEVLADGYLASGAYMLASQADQIFAANELVTVGSIGVATARTVSKSSKDITNTDSKDKRPDVSTEEGVAVVENELNDIYQILAERIADGRQISVEAVKKDYGQGAMMTARTALQKRMIDGIVENNSNKQQSAQAKGGKSIGVSNMKLEDLKVENPGLYQEVFALGVAAGSKEERDRVCAHLMLADGSGNVEAAHKAIQTGEGITEMVKAEHMAAAMKRNMLEARKEDNPPEVNTNGTAPTVDGLKEKEMKAQFESSHPGWEVQ
jgi:ClpP class serine protease